MNPEHAQFADWDAAYVLGALSADDRRDFEAHLAGCPECRRGVAELAPTVALMSRVSADDAELLLDDERAEPSESFARARLASLDAARRRRRRRTWFTASAAAAVVVIAAVAVPVTIAQQQQHPTASFALEDVSPVSLTASVRLTSVAWGTRIDLDCRYPDGPASAGMPKGGWTYVLAVIGQDGQTTSVSTWRAGPGSVSKLSAGTALDVAGIRSVQIRSTSGAVLMTYDLSKFS
jgi:anti-sigma factor RsiW